MPAHSTSWNKAINAVSAKDQPLYLLQIDHPALSTPVYVVNDLQNVTSNGIEYIGLAFNISLPTDPEVGNPVASLSIDNVGKELMYWLEVSNGGAGATATISQVLRSTPNNVEFTVTMNLSNIVANNQTVSANLNYDNLLTLSATPVIYSPTTSPGLY